MIKPYVVYIDEANTDKIKKMTKQKVSHLALQYVVMEWLDEHDKR